MGTINYKTSEFITLALEPYSVEDIIDDIQLNPSDYDIDKDKLDDEKFLYDYAYDYISQLYDDDLSNAEHTIKSYDNFDYFKIEIKPGYYAGYMIDIEPLFDFYVEEARKEALYEADEVGKLLKELAGEGYVACSPGWGTSYANYNTTIEEIDEAVKEMKKQINETPISESKQLNEAASVYSAKLNQFMSDQPKAVQQFVKSALNKIFIGIKDDFEGYEEGKRPTIKNYGGYQLFKMVIQAKSDVKKDSDDVKGKWNFHDPVSDYCSSLGKIIKKKIDGDSYECVVYNHTSDLENVYTRSDYENLTSQLVYPMVGCYSTGIGGNYKNLTKDYPGTTYSIVVSLPNANPENYTNTFMVKQGTEYKFGNDTHDSQGYKFSITYDMSDGEFTERKYKEGDPETFTAVYNKGRNGFKAFKELVDIFDSTTTAGDVGQLLTKYGIKVRHSWWFNPYYD